MWAWTRRGDIYDARRCRWSHNAGEATCRVRLETWGDANEARRCGLGPVGATFMTPGDVGGRIMLAKRGAFRVFEPPRAFPGPQLSSD